MINWKNPHDELPKDNEEVAVLIYHWKSHWPLSCEIYFGEVESCIDIETNERRVRVLNNDYIGQGSAQWYFFERDFCGDIIDAWCYAKDFKKPDFIIHDKRYDTDGV